MSNIRMLFISSYNSETIETSGVSKKLKSKIDTFQKMGFEVVYTEITTNGVFLVQENEKKQMVKWDGTYHKTFTLFYKKIKKLQYIKFDAIYFRFEHVSFEMLKYLKLAKQNNVKIIIGELPTYMGFPYKTSNLKTKITFYLKKIMNYLYRNTVDLLVTYSEHEKLFGIKTIQIENFANLSTIKPRKIKSNSKQECHLLALALLSPAHGVDLVIKGLSEYYKQENEIKCFLHVVGDGSVLNELKALTSSLHLEEYIFFHGVLGGKELDNIFDICDVGIGALAVFRKGSYKVSELKIREFTARCLPFIYNAYEPQIENQFFCKKIDFKEQPVNINEIIDFYTEFEYTNNNYKKMRDFAEKNFTPIKQLIPISQQIIKNINS